MDEIAQLRAADPARRASLGAVDSAAFVALREGIVMTGRQPLTRRRRIGRRGGAAIALCAALIGGGGAYAAFQTFNGGVVDGINCQSVFGVSDIIGDESADTPALTGDPVADCVGVRAAKGYAPLADPVAYTYHGMLFVTPRDQMPDGATPVQPSREATAARELEASVQDWVDGGRSACLTGDQMTALVTAEKARLGLSDWKVTAGPSSDSTDLRCASAWFDRPARTVSVSAHGNEAPSTSGFSAQVRDTLRAGITDTCVSLAAARAVADQAIGNEHHWQTTSVVDESARCARVDMEVGGSIQLTVYGPTDK